MATRTLCTDCEVPVCRQCEDALQQPRGAQMPYAALTNDLMTFYAPTLLYEKQATAMELICASVCLTTMISFTLEKKYRGEDRLFDQVAVFFGVCLRFLTGYGLPPPFVCVRHKRLTCFTAVPSFTVTQPALPSPPTLRVRHMCLTQT